MANRGGQARYSLGVDLDPDACYRALRTRDARFDGRFYTAVRSTGVYCRPICPARTPRRENCLFLPCAAAAQEAGYRPCLRCRPEASPGTPAWLGTSATVSRALRLIAEGALDQGGVDALAQRLGIGERHLRRLFLTHLGAPPLAVAQTRRIHFAKKLIDETDLPMSHVALASGFSSIRRFNDAIRHGYRRSPSALRQTRRRSGNGAGSSDISIKLPFRAPFDWEAVRNFLALRATPGVEAVGPDGYRRSVKLDGVHGTVEVSPAAGRNHLVARIRLSGPTVLIRVAERLRAIFDLGADPHPIAACLARDPQLRPALRAHPGLRIPGAWDGFELAVRAILGQQVTVRGATTLAGRLVEAYGEPLSLDGGRDLRFLFPEPAVLAGAELSGIGLPRARAAAISTLAAAVASGDLRLDATRGLEETVAKLKALPGIGEWTAQYVAMRALREPDAFPHSDLGLRRALGRPSQPLSPARLAKMAEAWRPWRAYAAVHLWTSGTTSAKR
jgi:AraC family transcriptional regulator of adaptative response / DNA-3-methyladenine glycosylase II